MPKNGIFNDSIMFACMMELREEITAMQYLQGDRDFSDTARNLMMRAIKREVEELDSYRKRRYNQILENARATTAIRKQKLAERAAARAAAAESSE